jgi:hypothetical protein
MQSNNGLARGRIDLARPIGTGVEIVDYKSGTLFDARNHLKTEYKLQMQLYAALYHAKVGQWPARATLIQMTGPETTVEVRPEACARVLDGMLGELARVNAAVKRAGDPEAPSTLATPSPSSCKFCDYRPVCTEYHRSRSPLIRDWPRDICGVMERKIVHKNDRVTFVVRDPNAPGSELVLRGVTDSPVRHPALESIPLGGTLAAYNCTQRTDGGSYSENLMTVIYPAWQ